MPEVTVIVPTYNRADLIGETLDSIARQDYPNWECLIVDDHSTDSTADLCGNYTANDPRFRYLLNAHSKGAQGARNTGIDQAAGRYLIFLDSDDLLGDACLSSRLSFVAQHPDYDYYCFATGVFKKKPGDTEFLWNLLTTADDDTIRFLRQDMPWHTSGVLWKKESVNVLNGWDEVVLSWQDWDIHLRALLNKNLRYYKAANDAIDSFYRVDGSSNAISITGYTSKSLNTRMYLIEKFFKLLPLQIESIRFEFAKLIYRLAQQIFQHYDKDVALKFLFDHLLKLGYSRLFCRSWCLYLAIKTDRSYHKLVKKMAGIIPMAYKSKSMLGNKRSHLNAVLAA